MQNKTKDDGGSGSKQDRKMIRNVSFCSRGKMRIKNKRKYACVLYQTRVYLYNKKLMNSCHEYNMFSTFHIFRVFLFIVLSVGLYVCVCMRVFFFSLLDFFFVREHFEWAHPKSYLSLCLYLTVFPLFPQTSRSISILSVYLFVMSSYVSFINLICKLHILHLPAWTYTYSVFKL